MPHGYDDEAWEEAVALAVAKSCAEQGIPVEADDETHLALARLLSS